MYRNLSDTDRRQVRLATGVPLTAALVAFYVARVAETEATAGTAFAVGLTLVVLAAVWGPYLHWSARVRQLEHTHEDDTADLRYRLDQTDKDVASLTAVLDDYLNRELAAVLPRLPLQCDRGYRRLLRDVEG